MAESYSYQESPSELGVVIRASDSATIPLDLANTDYQAFLQWVAEPNPAPEGWTGPLNPTPEDVA